MSELRRNLVFCCDGTMNEPSVPTNVWLFKDAVRRSSKATSEMPAQAVHYEKGVGTRKFEALRGGIVGYGREKRIRAGYAFLRDKYSNTDWAHDQNRIFLLGFSRGAYSARRLSGLLNFIGLPKSAKDEELGWELYQTRLKAGSKASAAQLKREKRFFDVNVEMVGVWDTVKATDDPDYDDKELPLNVVFGYHAMAIDEHRKFFKLLRWNAEKERVLEVWFAGVHSDVGGGYPRAGLSNIALRWMISRAEERGLQFLDDKVKAARRNSAHKIHDSMKGWELWGSNPREPRKKDWVHDSVRRKIKGTDKYEPDNLHLPTRPTYWPPVED